MRNRHWLCSGARIGHSRGFSLDRSEAIGHSALMSRGGRFSLSFVAGAVIAGVVVGGCGGGVKTEQVGGTGEDGGNKGSSGGASVRQGRSLRPQRMRPTSRRNRRPAAWTLAAVRQAVLRDGGGRGKVRPAAQGKHRSCTLCGGMWYCPEPRTPEPPCPPGVTFRAPCTTNCIQCASNGLVTEYSCGGGTPPFYDGTFTPFTCTP